MLHVVNMESKSEACWVKLAIRPVRNSGLGLWLLRESAGAPSGKIVWLAFKVLGLLSSGHDFSLLTLLTVFLTEGCDVSDPPSFTEVKIELEREGVLKTRKPNFTVGLETCHHCYVRHCSCLSYQNLLYCMLRPTLLSAEWEVNSPLIGACTSECLSCCLHLPACTYICATEYE